jgi:hypothetical protein
MENSPFVTTVLRIGGHAFNPDELTSLVGVTPTRIWHQKHESVKEVAPELATIGWEYKLEKQHQWSLGEAIDELLAPFWVKKEELKAFVSENHLQMSIRCIPYGDASIVQYIIAPMVLQKLGYIGATLSIAAYWTGGEKEQPERERKVSGVDFTLPIP